MELEIDRCNDPFIGDENKHSQEQLFKEQLTQEAARSRARRSVDDVMGVTA
jgi:hypothetical protein